MIPRSQPSQPFLDALYSNLLERGIQYFFPRISLEPLGPCFTHGPVIEYEKSAGGISLLRWLGMRYRLRNFRSLTLSEGKLMKSVGLVLSARYRFFFDPDLVSGIPDLFRGVPEDRYVSAFLDSTPYVAADAGAQVCDRIADAIDVLRISALTTYENRRIVTGVLVFGTHPDPCHVSPPRPPGALRYAAKLTSIRSFHRMCDGLQTLALVDQDGLLVELVDVAHWAQAYQGMELPVASAARYEYHCRATLCGGHTCLVLTPNGEIKVFAAGSQVLNFIDGSWRLTDPVEKYRVWEDAIGNKILAERIYRVALNLAEERRGGLFVVLDDAGAADHLLAPGDLLESPASQSSRDNSGAKGQLHYLLRGRPVSELPPTVLESVARIDGGIVMDRDFRLLAFGAILRLERLAETNEGVAEGGRTTAAIGASRYGHALKVSEDGLISFYAHGVRVWEM